jgi:hypothetical protein
MAALTAAQLRAALAQAETGRAVALAAAEPAGDAALDYWGLAAAPPPPVVVPCVSMAEGARDAIVEPLLPHQTLAGSRLALAGHPYFK